METEIPLNSPYQRVIFFWRRYMSDFSINEMLDMQKRLLDKYKDKWEKISPEAGKHKN